MLARTVIGQFQTIVLIAAVSLCSAAGAQVSGTWTNPSGGLWTVGSNWSCNPLYPTGGGVATFAPSGEPLAVTLSPNVELSSLSISQSPSFTLSGSGTLTMSGPATIDVAGDSVAAISTNLAATPALTKTGAGTLTLNDDGWLAGGVRVMGGTLRGTPQSLGGSSAPIYINGASLIPTSFFSTTRSFEAGPGGATLLADSSINYLGPIIGTGTVTFGAANGSVGFNSIQSVCTYTGPTVAIGHKVDLLGSGALVNTSAVYLIGQVSLAFSGPPVNRINDAAPIYAEGGQLQGNSFDNERVGDVVLGSAYSQISNVRVNTLSRSARRGTLSASSITIVGSLPALVGGGGPLATPSVGILPYVISPDTSHVWPATVAAGKIRPLTAAEFSATLSASSGSLNVLNTGQTITTPVIANSYTLAGGSLSGSGTLSVASGAIFFDGSGTIAAPLDFAATEGIIYAPTNGGLGTISGAISGSNGLTIGAGAVALSGASNYTGVTTINGELTVQGSVVPGAPGPLGSDSSPVVINGAAGNGRLYIAGSGSTTFGRDITAYSPGTHYSSISAAPSSTSAVEITGDIDVTGKLAVFGDSTATILISGSIHGAGSVYLPENLTLAGENTFTGGVYIGGGSLGIASDTALGTGQFRQTSGTLQAIGGPRVLANQWAVVSPTIVGPHPLTFTGPIMLGGEGGGGSSTLTVSSDSLLTLTGPMVGQRIVKLGDGAIQFPRIRLPQLTINAGSARLLPDGTNAATSKIGTLTILAGANFDLTDNELIIDYTGATVAGTVRSMLLDGRLRSSLADATHALGYLDNAALGWTTFGGLPVDASSILIRFTHPGDTNLDGQVDITDLAALATSWQSPGTWINGDFNYDGFIDITDLARLATNWQAGVGAPLSMSFEQALASVGLGGVSVPEPAWAGAIAICGLLGSRRNRRA